MNAFPHRVSYVGSEKDQTVLMAIDVQYDNQTIRWFDTVKERIMTIGKVIDPDPTRFVFERAQDEGGGTYTFVPLTLEIFRERVKNHILVPRDFDNEEELLAALIKTYENAW